VLTLFWTLLACGYTAARKDPEHHDLNTP
jgi:hypothetical protein